jgi:hypothetical protein
MTDLSETSVFRLHIRPRGGLADPQISFSYCIREQVLGMGWAVTSPEKRSFTWEEYEALAISQHGDDNLSRVRCLRNKVRTDDLIWTRDTRGCYYLGRVTSPWEYFEASGSLDADVVNIVRCNIQRIEAIDDIPGKVVACFRPSRTIQSIADNAAVRYTKFLWNKLSGASYYPVPPIGNQSLYSLLDSETVEDVIFIYLQMQGWLVVPHSRKVDTMGFEYVLINRDTAERATVQVKTGNTPLDTSEWKGMGTVFLFQANGVYCGEQASNVICLRPDSILEFIRANLSLMPAVVQRWSNYAWGDCT